VSDIQEERATPDQTTKTSFFENLLTGADPTGRPGHKASIEDLISRTAAAGLYLPSDERPDGVTNEPTRAFYEQTVPKKITDPRFEGGHNSWYPADPSGNGSVPADTVVLGRTEATLRAVVSHSDKKSVDDSLDVTKKSLQRGNSGPLNLRSLTPGDWPMLRASRLQALLNSPHAFTSTYAREAGWSEPEWRRLFNSAMWIVARDAHKVVGLARSVTETERSIRHVESIWVASTHRRRGVFRALLDAITDLERRSGATDLLLWVLEDNYTAQRTYKALGFEPTGERQFLPTMRRFERRLRLGIGRLEDSSGRSLLQNPPRQHQTRRASSSSAPENS
jgi:ribosomal protein S18 acetylase RimI-like enzyme